MRKAFAAAVTVIGIAFQAASAHAEGQTGIAGWSTLCPSKSPDHAAFDSKIVWPKRISGLNPKYPSRPVQNSSEGFVLLGAKINTDGAVSDIAPWFVGGPQEFVDAATNAVKTWVYAPATYGGKPIESYLYDVEVEFRIDNAQTAGAVHRNIVEAYETGLKLMKRQNFDEAISLFEAALLKAEDDSRLNQYEQALISILLSHAYSATGQNAKALVSARRAFYADGANLPPEMAAAGERLRTFLELLNGNLAYLNCEKRTFDVKEPAPKFVSDALYEDMVSRSREALNSAEPIVVDGELASGPWAGGEAIWDHQMVRRFYAFDAVSSGVKRFRLYCQTQIVNADVDPKSEWKIPVSAGRCMLRVFGEPGAKFKFVEAW